MDEPSDQSVENSDTPNVFEAAARVLSEVRELVVSGSELTKLMDENRSQIDAGLSEATRGFQETAQQSRKEVEHLLEGFSQESTKILRKVDDVGREVGIAQDKVLRAREDIQQMSRETASALDEVRLAFQSFDRAINWMKAVFALTAVNLAALIFLLIRT